MSSDSRSDVYSPVFGHLAELGVSWMGSETTDLDNADTIWQLEGDWRQYVTLSLRVVWAGPLAGGGSKSNPNYLFRYYFISSYRISQAKLVLREQENRQLSAEKQIAEIRLRRLQAQIEPHFLFNMLSNIHGLIELDPQRASHALESFSDYLLKPVSLGRLKKTVLRLKQRLRTEPSMLVSDLLDKLGCSSTAPLQWIHAGIRDETEKLKILIAGLRESLNC